MNALIAFLILLAMFLSVLDGIWGSDRTKDIRFAWKAIATIFAIIGGVVLWFVTEPSRESVGPKPPVTAFVTTSVDALPVHFEVTAGSELRTVNFRCGFHQLISAFNDVIDDAKAEITPAYIDSLSPGSTFRTSCRIAAGDFRVTSGIVELEVGFSEVGKPGRSIVKKVFRYRPDGAKGRWDLVK